MSAPTPDLLAALRAATEQLRAMSIFATQGRVEAQSSESFREHIRSAVAAIKAADAAIATAEGL